MLERGIRSDQLDTMRAQVAAAEGLLDYAVTEMREIMQELRPTELDEESLLAKLGEYVRWFESYSGIPVNLKVAGTEGPLDSHVQTSIFRVAQEALANARKHARARTVELEISFAPDAVECVVRDDGVGFDADRAAALRSTSYWGITGMRERMLLIGGDLEITSAPGDGTQVRVRVPLGAA
jgi:signal transduction histidine kinase